jgi:hypothetical protein
MTFALAVLGVFMFTGSLRGISSMLVPAIVYLLPALAVQAASGQPMRRWMARVPSPVEWVIFVGVQLTAAGATVAVASFLMLVTGMARNWRDLYQANRVVIVVMVLMTCAVELYSSTRSRLEQRNRQLEERVEAESRALQLHEQDFERAREIQQALEVRRPLRACLLLEAVRIEVLGRKGLARAASKDMGKLAPEERAAHRQAAQRRQAALEQAFETRQRQLRGSPGSAPGRRMARSHAARARPAARPSAPHHAIPARNRRPLRSLGFAVLDGPEVEDRIPQFRRAQHPGRPSRARHAGHLLAGPAATCCARTLRRCRCAAWSAWGRRCA